MKKRLDQIVVERGFAPSRDEARRLILAGRIRVAGEVRDKAGRSYDVTLPVEVVGPANPYVGRGGLKLEHALEAFDVKVPVEGPALDIGASTGGFTDCLLQRGAAEVIAVDAGRAQLHEKLRADPRVRVMEKTNARYLTLEAIGGRPAELVVIDVSFISLRLILPACAGLLAPGGRVIALVKPQFEAGRREVGSGGVVRDPAVHRRVLEGLAHYFEGTGWRLLGLTASPVRGSDGNLEFFALLDRGETGEAGPSAGAMIDNLLGRPSVAAGDGAAGDEKPVESP
jgi:23S rRNA (cytidine1920-2'-O)/16S rRNA (cytidine1409-2'-O)-methyltransferase